MLLSFAPNPVCEVFVAPEVVGHGVRLVAVVSVVQGDAAEIAQNDLRHSDVMEVFG
jgi:hypothetical protein